MPKTQISKIVQSGGFHRIILGWLPKAGLPWMKNVLTSLARSILIPLGLTASAADTWIHKKTLGSGTTILIISNEEMGDIKIVK